MGACQAHVEEVALANEAVGAINAVDRGEWDSATTLNPKP